MSSKHKDKCKVVSLNVRGLRKCKKRTKLYNWLYSHGGKSGVCFVQEAHCTFEDEKRWRKDWKGLSFFSHGKTNSCGVLTLIGDSIDFKLLDKVVDDKGRYILLHCNIQNTQILLINSYFPNLESQQVEFIRSISDSISCMNIGNSTQIIWGGDFNFCFSCIDTDGGNYKPKQKVINLIENTLTNLELSDIWRIRNPDSRQYTWKTINPIIQRRLDFFLISNDLQPLVINSDIVSTIDTDHNAIILDINLKTNIKHGPAYWKFNLSLLQDIEYTEIMKLNIEQWKKDIKCTDTRVLWEYLKYKVRNFTISYSKGKARSRHENAKQLEEKVNELEKKLTSNSSSELLEELQEAKGQLNDHYDYLTRGAILRSKCKWYEEGEKNSNYFLNLEKRNKSKSSIRSLIVNGKEISDQSEILQEIKSYFVHKYSNIINKTEEECRSFLGKVNLPNLSESQALTMDAPITIQEVLSALEDMGNSKSPGNDGLQKEFYLFFFELLGPLLTDCINTCHQVGELTTSQKQAVITLIEKPGKDLRMLKAWRPISLLNVDLKVTSKVLATRLKKFLPDLVSEEQSAFIPGEPIRIISDLMHYCKENKYPGLLLAADFEAAFDSLYHPFVFEVFKKFGFGHSFIKWLQIMHNNVESCVLNDGISTGYFKIERGTRQGDPLAPYVFILVIEVLAAMVRQNEDIKGITINGQEIKQCIFADDTTYFFKRYRFTYSA